MENNKMEIAETSREIFKKLLSENTFEEVHKFSNDFSNLLWERRRTEHEDLIKSQRKGAILQVIDGSHFLSGERVKLLRKNPKYAGIKCLTGRGKKGYVGEIAYSWLTTELKDLEKSRKKSQMIRNVNRALSHALGR